MLHLSGFCLSSSVCVNLIFPTITSSRRESWCILQCRGREGESFYFRGECLPQIEESLWMQSSRGWAGNYIAMGCYFSSSETCPLLLFLPNNKRYSCDTLLFSTLRLMNASHCKGCNAELPSRSLCSIIPHSLCEYELMAALVWAEDIHWEVSCFISRPSTLLSNFIKDRSVFATHRLSPSSSLTHVEYKEGKDELNGSSPAAEEVAQFLLNFTSCRIITD